MKAARKAASNFSLDSIKGPALALGVIAFLAGLGSFLIYGFDTATRILLAIGILLVGVFVAIDPEDVWNRLTTRGSLYSGNALLLAGAVIGVLALINVVSNNRHQRWDVTANKQYTLSEQSAKVVSELPAPVQVEAFYQDDDPRKREAEDLLKEYQVRSGGKFTTEILDPDRQPARAQQAGIKEYGTTVMTMGDRKQTVTGSRESDFTTALLRLANPTQKKIYFTTGHQERRIDGFDRDGYGAIKTSLESDNYVVDTLVLAATNEVPQDAAAVIVAQPRSPLSPDEIQGLKNYLDRGGKLMLLTQPSLGPNQQQVPLGELVSKWGVEIGSAPVAEGNPQLAMQGEPLAPVVVRYPFHKITEGLGLSYFPTTTYITAPTDSSREATISKLAETSDRSWAETDPRSLRFDEGIDPKGPLTIATAIDASAESAPPSQDQEQPQPKTRVVIFGDADFAASGYSALAPGNRDLFMNATNWLTEEEQLISIRPKERDNRTLMLSAAQQNMVLYTSTLFLPLIVLAIGGLIWWSRR